MTSFTNDLLVASQRYGNLDSNDPRSWTRAPCAFCGGDQMTVVAATSPNVSDGRPSVAWLRCVSCQNGVVVNADKVSPEVMPLDTPSALKGGDLAAWAEVRGCLSVGAYTAAVMMCRKLLFHIAVAHDLPEKNEKDRAPSFAEALNHLEEEGVFTKKMRPWVDRIKDVGNEANHELNGVTREQAMDVATFTRQLLHMAYELPSMIGPSEPALPSAE